MRVPAIVFGAAAFAFSGTAFAQAIAGDAAVQAQWFTGSLEAPSPALPKAGIIAFEPYAIFQFDNGAYGDTGAHYSVQNDITQFQSVNEVKYGITDQLTVAATPDSCAYLERSVEFHWHRRFAGRTRISLQRRGQQDRFPVLYGFTWHDLPDRDVRQSADADAWSGRWRLHAQGRDSGRNRCSNSWGHHPMRFRFYAEAFEPVANVSLQGISSYGTSQGFQGSAMPGISSVFGIGAGYGLDQRWVLAFDLVQNFANGARVRGVDGSSTANSNAPARSARKLPRRSSTTGPIQSA